MATLDKYTKPVTIANGASLSSAIDLNEGRAALLIMPAAWTAADISFQVSADGVTFVDLFKTDGTEYTLTVAASRGILLPLSDFLGIRHMKIRSGKTGAAVNQLANRALSLWLVG